MTQAFIHANDTYSSIDLLSDGGISTTNHVLIFVVCVVLLYIFTLITIYIQV